MILEVRQDRENNFKWGRGHFGSDQPINKEGINNYDMRLAGNNFDFIRGKKLIF
jgi:hypothetical protein